MSNIRKYLDITVNIVVIATCILLCWSYISHGGLHRRPKTAAEEAEQLKGKHLVVLPNYNWSSHPKTLVLAIKNGCHYCEASMPFYQELNSMALNESSRPHLLAVMPDSKNVGSQVLASGNLNVDAVFGESLESINVSGTPTLLLVDDKGRVQQAWIGQLPQQKEAEVVKAMSQ